MNIPKVIGSNILLTIIEKEPEKNILIIPEHNSREDKECKVVSIGSKVTEVKSGDVIIIAHYDGRNVTIDDINYLLISEDEIIAIRQ